MTEFLSRLFIKNHNNVKDAKVRSAYGTLSTFVGITANFLLSAVKLIVGTIAASSAIVADALNNLSDAGSSLITFVSFKLSSKPADREHPFGHARIEYIASMIVSFLILLVGFETLSSTFLVLIGINESEPIVFSIFTIIILGISVLAKLWLAFFYRKIGKRINSSVLLASSTDSLIDSLSTVAVLISSIVIKFTDIQIIDTVVSLIVSFMIIFAGIKILNETKNSLLGEAPVDEEIKKINKIISEYPEILGIHDLMIHNYGPNHYITSLHAEVDGKADVYYLHDTIDNIEKRINNELNMICTIHMDPIVTDDDTLNELKSFLQNIIETEVSPNITVHDFRTVVGITHTNLIFDIVVPFENTEPPQKIVERICEAVKAKRNDCYCVITVDRG